MPERVQRKRTKGWKMPDNTVSVTRPRLFGNPFRSEDPAKAVEYFRRYMEGEEVFDCGPSTGVYLFFVPDGNHRELVKEHLPSLKGKNLACFCPIGQPCHADVLLEWANREEEP